MTEMTHGLAALVDELAESADERAVIARALELLPYAVRPSEPPASLLERVMSQVTDERGPATFEKDGFYFARVKQLPNLPYGDGITVKLAWLDEKTGARAVLVQMPPHTEFPEHGHDHIEDLTVLEGEATIAGVTMRVGDYCRAPAGTSHTDMRSGPNGVVAFVVQR